MQTSFLLDRAYMVISVIAQVISWVVLAAHSYSSEELGVY